MKYIIPALSVLLFSQCNEQNIRVGLQPYESFETQWVDTVSNTIESIYGIETVILPAIPLPDKAFTRIKSPRYRADTLIRILRHHKPDSLDYIIGLTKKDISVTKKDKNGNIKQPEYKYADWGILGLGFCPGSSCVVSTFRLYHSDEKKFIDRLKKVSLHELGHNLGLQHCPSDDCLMRDAAESVQTVDFVKLSLCDKCKRTAKLNH